MKALLASALLALLLTPAVAADEAEPQACLVDGRDPDIDLVCTGPFEICLAGGDVWDRLTREGFGCFAT